MSISFVVCLTSNLSICSDYPWSLGIPLSLAHLIRRHRESAIQVFHKLFEGGSLRRCSMPAVSHHHISKREWEKWRGSQKHTNIQNDSSPTHLVHIHINSHSSWVHVEGRSMRWPSFSSLNSSSTGTPGYGEPPRVKISQSSTPKDHLDQRKGDITSFSPLDCCVNCEYLIIQSTEVVHFTYTSLWWV